MESSFGGPPPEAFHRVNRIVKSFQNLKREVLTTEDTGNNQLNRWKESNSSTNQRFDQNLTIRLFDYLTNH